MNADTTHERTAKLVRERRSQLLKGFREAVDEGIEALERGQPLPFTVSGLLAMTEIGFTFQIGSNPLLESKKDSEE